MSGKVAAFAALMLLLAISLEQASPAVAGHHANLPDTGAWFGAFVAIDPHTGPDRRTPSP